MAIHLRKGLSNETPLHIYDVASDLEAFEHEAGNEGPVIICKSSREVADKSVSRAYAVD